MTEEPLDLPDADLAEQKTIYAPGSFSGRTALISGGAALYLALSGDGESGQRKRTSAQRSIVVAPTVNGMVLHGVW